MMENLVDPPKLYNHNGPPSDEDMMGPLNDWNHTRVQLIKKSYCSP